MLRLSSAAPPTPVSQVDEGETDQTSPEACIEIDGHLLRIINVDHKVPQQSGHRGRDRIRFSYAAREVVHFDLSGHRYALVLAEDDPVAAPWQASAGDASSLPIHLLLTNRELQIVQLVCMGLLTKQIADRLLLSEFTVRSYLKMIYCKLGVHSRGAMVYRYARSMALPAAEQGLR